MCVVGRVRFGFGFFKLWSVKAKKDIPREQCSDVKKVSLFVFVKQGVSNSQIAK